MYDEAYVDDHEIPKGSSSSSTSNEEFLQWCFDTWGIDTSLVKIDVFLYNDYILAMEDRVDIFCEDCYDASGDDGNTNNNDEDGLDFFGHGLYYYDDLEEDRLVSVTDYPSVPVRGLKAARNLNVGEVVLSIPHQALWTLSNILDKDPVLSKIMGKEMREQHGWDSPIDEIPLLAIALLYHLTLLRPDSGKRSSLHAPYLQMLFQQDLDDFIPHLWSSHKLRKAATPQVRKVAKGIQRDVVEMYETIVLVLVEEHPDVFGEPWEENRSVDDDVNLTNDKNGENRRLVDETGAEWMYSLQRFHWAFALINSRHWHLPVPENVSENPPPNERDVDDGESPTMTENDDNVSFNDQPPASMPTEEWMQHQREQQMKEEERDSDSESLLHGTAPVEGNSFLAPLADLLNFGPPCTRGMYNHTTDSFEIIATCPFRKGQEITFWYADACEDVFMANYGFTMPFLVPKCPNAKDEAAATIRHLSQDLGFAYQQLDRMDQQIDELLGVLHDCHCENQTDYLKLSKGGNQEGSRPPKAPSPPRDEDSPDRHGQYRVDNRSGVRDSRDTNTFQHRRSNDARHAIRGRSRRSAKEGSRGGGSSSKGHGRKPRSGASRKSEF